MVAFHPPDEPFVIKESSNLKDGLNRLKKTNGLPLVVVDNHLTLVGILSSGDIARYLEKQNIVNIKSCTISEITNKNPILGHSNDTINMGNSRRSSKHDRRRVSGGSNDEKEAQKNEEKGSSHLLSSL